MDERLMSQMASSDGNLVQLSGPVTLYESTEIREPLLAALALDRDVVIDLETSGPWDLAGLQLLLATSVSAQKGGHAVRFIQVPKVCVEIAERAGLGGWLRERTDSFL